MTKVLASAAILLAYSGINARAHSILSGVTVSANWNFPMIGTLYEGSTPPSAVVGPSDALFVFGPFNTAMDIDVSATTDIITLDGENNGADGGFYLSGTFNGFVISVLNPSPGFAFTGVGIQSINWDNQTPPISFDPTDIYVNMQGLTQIGPGSDIVLSYTASTATPEPGSILLLGSGALGLAGVLRRKFLR